VPLRDDDTVELSTAPQNESKFFVSDTEPACFRFGAVSLTGQSLPTAIPTKSAYDPIGYLTLPQISFSRSCSLGSCLLSSARTNG